MLYLLELITNHWNWTVFAVCIVVPGLILMFGRKNEPLVSSIPGFCTSIGITTTFAVLYFTLSNLPQNPDVDYVIKELSNKFSASLIGILFSISYNLLIKIWKPYREKSEYWKYEDPQKMLFELKTESRRTSEQMDHAINVLVQSNEEKNKTQEAIINIHKENLYITKRIHASIEDLYSYTIKELRELNETTDRIRYGLEKSLSEIADQFKVHIESSIGKVTEDSHSVLHELIQKINQDFSDETQKNLKEYQAEVGKLLSSMNETFLKLESSISVLSGQMKVQNEEYVKDTAESAKNIKEGFEQTTQEFMKTLLEQTDNMNQIFERLSISIESFDKKLASASDNLFDQSVERMEAAIQRIQEIEARHLTLLENITRAFGDSVEKYGDVSLLHSDVLKKIAEQAQSMEGLNNSNTQLIEALISNLELINRIKEEVAALFNTVDYLQSVRTSIHNSNGTT